MHFKTTRERKQRESTRNKNISQSIHCIKSLLLKFIISIYLKIVSRYRENRSIIELNKIFHLFRLCKNTNT